MVDCAFPSTRHVPRRTARDDDLVAQVTAGRTTNPDHLSAAELEQLVDLWRQEHHSVRITAGAPTSGVRAHVESDGGQARRALGDRAPADDARHRSMGKVSPRVHATADANESARHSGGDRRDGDERGERYVVAIGVDLHAALRAHAFRRRAQMRVVVADAVSELLARLDAGQPLPTLPERWCAPSTERTRLAMRWPAGLADQVRAMAARQGRPAHELVALALLPVVAPRTRAGAR